jgi:regulator of nucleoside diphosphate kinase
MLPRIVLTVSAHGYLRLLISVLRGRSSDDILEFLDQEVARADLVADHELCDRIAALGRRVVFRDNILMIEKCVTLAYPGSENHIFDALSVLTPEGACLIGLPEGRSMQYWQNDQIICDVTLRSVLHSVS